MPWDYDIIGVFTIAKRAELEVYVSKGIFFSGSPFTSQENSSCSFILKTKGRSSSFAIPRVEFPVPPITLIVSFGG